MSLWIGTSNNKVDLIANIINRSDVEQIIERYFKPSIGELKYIAISNYNNHINIDSSTKIGIPEEEFNGWVTPNGMTLDSHYFNDETIDFFNGDENTFTLPTIDQFIKAYADNSRSSDIQPCQSYLLNHQHHIDSELKFNVGGRMTNFFKVYSDGNDSVHKIYDGTDKRWYPEMHRGSGTGVIRMMDLVLPASANYNLIKTALNGVVYDSIDCYPEHIYLNVLIYIGQKKIIEKENIEEGII